MTEELTHEERRARALARAEEVFAQADAQARAERLVAEAEARRPWNRFRRFLLRIAELANG